MQNLYPELLLGKLCALFYYVCLSFAHSVSLSAHQASRFLLCAAQGQLFRFADDDILFIELRCELRLLLISDRLRKDTMLAFDHADRAPDVLHVRCVIAPLLMDRPDHIDR